MWKVKEFNGRGNVDYLINDFIKENAIEDFKIEGVAVTYGEIVNVIIKYWEDTSLRKKLEPIKAAAFDDIFDVYKDLDLNEAESFKEIGKLINKGLRESFDLEKRLNNDK